MTPERKKQSLENLKRGRIKAAENRKKKALVKKIKRQEQDDEIDEVIVKSIAKKKQTKQIFNDYEDLKKRYEILNNEYTEFRTSNSTPIREPEPNIIMEHINLEPIVEEVEKGHQQPKVVKIGGMSSSLWDL